VNKKIEKYKIGGCSTNNNYFLKNIAIKNNVTTNATIPSIINPAEWIIWSLEPMNANIKTKPNNPPKINSKILPIISPPFHLLLCKFLQFR